MRKCQSKKRLCKMPKKNSCAASLRFFKNHLSTRTFSTPTPMFQMHTIMEKKKRKISEDDFGAKHMAEIMVDSFLRVLMNVMN